jgi:Zn-dependent metalloprotease
MNKHSHDHKDGFVPKQLLKKLAEDGSEEAKKTLMKMNSIMEKGDEFKKKNESVNSFFDDSANKSERFIYDSENTENFQWKLKLSEGQNPSDDEIVNIVYDYCGLTLEYFKTKFGRNSIDDRGMNLINNIHYDKKLNNAFWYMDQMSYGDGDGEDFISFARSIDVIAHELSHGVTEYINQLKYEHQSGALNEHFSDVMGSAVKQYVKGQTAKNADWLIGDEIIGPKFPGIALRSMREPGTANKYDFQPSHFSKYVKLPNNDDNDWGGVHLYSGIPNRAFYLVAMEIGTDAAAFLWYKAFQNKNIIHPEATFQEAFEAILSTSEALIQQTQLPREATEIVRNAFKQVGIGSLVTV